MTYTRRRRYKKHKHKSRRRGGAFMPLPTRADVMAVNTAIPKAAPAPAPPKQSRGNFLYNFFGNLFNRLRGKSNTTKKDIAVAATAAAIPPAPPSPTFYPSDPYTYQGAPLEESKKAPISTLFETGNPQKRFLEAMCSNSNECVAFGRESDRLTQFFEFTNFKYVSRLTKVSSGANGFVINLSYYREGYTANAILKSSLDDAADSLYLEAYNGFKYINRYALQFPCFLETYGVFMYNGHSNEHMYHYGEGNYPSTRVGSLPRMLTLMASPTTYTTEIADMTCKNNVNIAILMQYVDRAITFDAWLKANINGDGYPVQVDLPCILFQIYSVLATLNTARVFTHYDLHTSNVLLYPVPNGEYVTITYKNAVGQTTVSIKTRYIVKIIDYGRAYMPDNRTIHNVLCSAPDCNMTVTYRDQWTERIDEMHNKCGNETGYNYFGNNAPEYDFYINRTKSNNAHDVKLIASIIRYVTSRSMEFDAWTRNPGTAHIKYILKNANMNYHDASRFVGSPNIIQRTRAENFYIPFDTIKEMMRTRTWPAIRTVQEVYWALFNLVAGDETFTAAMESQSRGLRQYGTLTVDLAFNMSAIKPTVFVKEGIIAPMTSLPTSSARQQVAESPVMSPLHLPTQAATATAAPAPPPEMSPFNLPEWDYQHDENALADISLDSD